jgi:predicted phage-related endonuclease
MATIASLQAELQNLTDKISATHDAAAKHRTSAANYSANGYGDKAQNETAAALAADNEAADYQAKSQAITSQIQDLEQQARQIEGQISNLQSKLAAITGSTQSTFL